MPKSRAQFKFFNFKKAKSDNYSPLSEGKEYIRVNGQKSPGQLFKSIPFRRPFTNIFVLKKKDGRNIKS